MSKFTVSIVLTDLYENIVAWCVGELPRRFGGTMVSIFKGISVDVSVAGYESRWSLRTYLLSIVLFVLLNLSESLIFIKHLL
jgi:hypothetical protein